MLDILLKTTDGKLSVNSPTLDKVDASKGYTKDNIWVISHKANTIKSDATLEELKLVALRVEEKLRARTS